MFEVNTRPPTTVKQRKGQRYAIGTDGADGAFLVRIFSTELRPARPYRHVVLADDVAGPSRKARGGADLPTGRQWVGIWKYIVAQGSSRDRTGKVRGGRRGAEATLARAPAQDTHQPFGDHRQRPGHLLVRETRLQVELPPRRLLFDKNRD